MLEQYLWVEKYRPKTIGDTILPVELKQMFQSYVDQKNIPNLILSGSAGVGKTTVARAMLEELGCDYIMINGSMILFLKLQVRMKPQFFENSSMKLRRAGWVELGLR